MPAEHSAYLLDKDVIDFDGCSRNVTQNKNHANSYDQLYLQSLIRQVPKRFTLVRHAVHLHGVCLHRERGGRKVLGCSAGHEHIYICGDCNASRIWASGVLAMKNTVISVSDSRVVNIMASMKRRILWDDSR